MGGYAVSQHACPNFGWKEGNPACSFDIRVGLRHILKPSMASLPEPPQFILTLFLPASSTSVPTLGETKPKKIYFSFIFSQAYLQQTHEALDSSILQLAMTITHPICTPRVPISATGTRSYASRRPVFESMPVGIVGPIRCRSRACR